jgi:hypothetical protein
MQNKFKLSSNGVDSGSKKSKGNNGDAYGGVWRESGVIGSVLCCAFGRNLAGFSRREEFSCFFLPFKKFCKSCNFNAIYKDNTAIICITFQHNKVSLPSTLTGHTTLV